MKPDVLSVVFEGKDRFGQRHTGHEYITNIQRFVEAKEADGWTWMEVISLQTGDLVGGIEPRCWSRHPTDQSTEPLPGPLGDLFYQLLNLSRRNLPARQERPF